MNEGNSAGGGHEGLSPAPPAVSDRVTLQSTEKSVTTPKSTATAHNNNKSSSATSTVATTQQKPSKQQQQQQQLLSAQLPVPLSNLSTEATAAATPAAASTYSSNSAKADTSVSESISPPQAKRQRLEDTEVGGEVASDNNNSNIVGAVSSNIVGSLLPASVVASSEVGGAISTALQDLNALKKRILQQKYQILRNLKERHLENVSEYFYLQNGGSMMDYPAWRKKTPTPQFISYSNANRIEQLILEEKPSTSAAAAAVAQGHRTTQQPTQQQPQQSSDSVVSNSNSSSSSSPATATTTSTGTTGKQLETDNSTQTKTNTQSLLPTKSGSNTTAVTATASSSPNRGGPTTTTTTTVAATGVLPITSSLVETSGNALPPEAEIKIPAVGATPVAVSTKLPAAVVQLTQQGGTPLVPCSSSSGSAALRRPNSQQNAAGTQSASTGGATSSPLYTGGANGTSATVGSGSGGVLTPCTPGGSSGSLMSPLASTGTPNSAQEFSFKAKQEVYVMQRISELQREGLWTERRLPKLQEPSRPKAHWDYLLEEMVWLAADFAQERKWKKNAAKKCAKMVQKYFQDKANAAQRAEKAQELHLKRVASFIAREVKSFWSNVEKLVEYKHQTKIEEKRKQALDQHLSFIVDQTEKFSQQLAEGMNKNVAETPSLTSSRLTSPKRESDDEFRPESGSEDDEETIAKAEEEAADVNEEVKALAKESQMDFDDFLNDLPPGYLENRDKLLLEEQNSTKGASTSAAAAEADDSDDSEFQAKEASDDDENTISKQEEAEQEVDHQKEIDELEADNDLTVEQLLEKYKSGKINEPPSAKRRKIAVETSEQDSDDDSTAIEDSTDSSEVEASEEEDEDMSTVKSNSDQEEGEQEDGLKSLLADADGSGVDGARSAAGVGSKDNKDDMLNDAAALAESLQPKGNTLSSTNVVTPVPFLLKHTLREYQHIGLDWLVTMNERKLNGILADEMGLGKTIQTIALLAHLACAKGNWGPHLIVVPSSVMLNWEMEFKKWCPGFKILTYYGTQKERKLKRVGWTKPNAFHVCITSYKLVVQDQQSFRRKKWKYLILDEAQNIKNFKSQRWQLLLNFSTERRLLLTGTPLQNDLMELWSLMHFLMPYVFSSHREFKEWFSNPMTGMIEGNMEYNETLIARLHKVIRPFLLRRLKKEVEKQMPKKYEHVVMCRLSNRQRYLYEDFMSRSKTRETLQTGNLLSVINVLMQLRKVCNHPNMFEVRPTISPFQMEGIAFHTPRLVSDILEYDPFTQINLETVNMLLLHLEQTLTAYVSHKSRLLSPPRKLIEEIDSAPLPPPRCPNGKYRFHIRVRSAELAQRIKLQAVRVGASPAMRLEGSKIVPMRTLLPSGHVLKRVTGTINPINMALKPVIINSLTSTTASNSSSSSSTPLNVLGNSSKLLSSRSPIGAPTPAKVAKTMQDGKPFFYLAPATNTGGAGARLTLTSKTTSASSTVSATAVSATATSSSSAAQMQQLIKDPIVKDLATHVKLTAQRQTNGKTQDEDSKSTSEEAEDPYRVQQLIQMRKEQRLASLKRMAHINRRRTDATPIYGADCREAIEGCMQATRTAKHSTWQTRGFANCTVAMRHHDDNWSLNRLLKNYEQRCAELAPIFANFVIYVPSVCAPRIRRYVQNLSSTHWQTERQIETTITQSLSPKLALLHPIISAMTTQFPDPRLIQYDCGKLQTLDRLLRQLKVDGHRVLIFTQMTKMLDVLEAFLNYHGHIYLRLDGSTRVEQRQILMERFNGDKRIFCFILSTRSGGVGVNLTGADTVIFYDSDWNPTMDAQAQDRCHRIGQTRDVHIYRLVSEKTIEVNILKKANQKRMLSDMAIEGGNFTTTFFKSTTIKDLFAVDQSQESEDGQDKPDEKDKIIAAEVEPVVETEKQSLRAFEHALAAAEDEQDVQATKTAKAEAAADLAEFDENIPIADETNADGGSAPVELSKADLEMQNLVKQLSPIERYAMRFVEATGAAWTAEQLRAAEAELEMQKREWEANRLAAMQKEEQLLKQETESEELLTYSRKDASNQVNTKQDSNLSKRTSIVAVGGIRLTKQNKRDKRFKQHGITRGGPGLSRSVSNHKSRSNVQQTSPVRTRRNSLNVSAPARSSCNTNNSSKKSVTGTLPAPSRRQTRLHSLGEDNVTVTATATPPTRKTTRTAMAAAGGTSTPVSEERPKRQSANIAMTKLMKTQVRPAAATATTPAKNTTQVAKPKRRESVSLTSAANRRKLLERRATISSPLALKGNDSDDEDEDEGDTNERDDDEEGDGDSEEEDESIQVDDDEDKDEDEQEDDEETVVSGSASASAQEDTTQTEDEELHVERLEEEEDEEEEEEDEELNVETQSSSSYATAGEGGDSLDGWNAHTQVQDTTMTSSTYYNVSEESDTDETNDPLSVSKAENKTETKESTPALQRQRSNSSRGGSDEPIGHTPRTRSRGSVKINLWTLDVSPVPNIQKSTGSGASKNVVKRTTPQVETKLKGRQRQPAGGNRRLIKKLNEGQTTTLSRWITQTPRVRLRSSNAGIAMPSNSSSNTSAASATMGSAVAAKTGANGASSNR
ncbi:PREDICTED: helicase domino isoform X1 [Drosophila arizonae]|uniref:Helicase domino isoform X1 n=1 Tax=Drosophila arizonae TaxID=7263 RepID=A0ABM1PEV8_DROAR|nr:PREDICTED: helicase domino isoform X1 [Drosophila arizonae]